MKSLLIASVFLFIGACATQSHREKIQDIKDGIVIHEQEKIINYANTITAKELKTHLYVFASEAFEGRRTGSDGQKLAADFLKRYYLREKIASPFDDGTYYQIIPASYMGEGYNDTENVLAFVEGSEKAEEVVVISAHYDHEGKNNKGIVYIGADDDGSGTVALLEMAQAFQQAKKDGNGPKRSILFLHTTAEEIGLQGSRFYTENPLFPIENTVANLNIDMIGRVDTSYKNNGRQDYVYIIGSDRLSNELHYINEAVNSTFFDLELNYKYNAIDDRNRYYFRSDHYNFARNNVPVIFYFNGEHEDYHRVTDTPDKINYELLAKRAKLVFGTAWQLANQEKRIALNKS